jgi:hypothetical protein
MKMTDETNTAFHHVPTFSEKFWRWVGFRYHLGEDAPDADLLQGWIRTDSGFNFDWHDRLRILLTGKLRISTIIHMDTPSPSVTKTRLDWHILAPGEKP